MTDAIPAQQTGSPLRPPPAIPSDRQTELRDVAAYLEAAFLEEMLKHAGFGAARDSFGGGVGEEQFASLLRTEHARAMTQAGGIGLSEAIYRSLLTREAPTLREGTR